MILDKINEIEISEKELISITGLKEFRSEKLPSAKDIILRPSIISKIDSIVKSYVEQSKTWASVVIMGMFIFVIFVIFLVLLIFFNETDLGNPVVLTVSILMALTPIIIYIFFLKHFVKILFNKDLKKIDALKKIKPNILGCLLDQVDKYNAAAVKIKTAKKLFDAGNEINIQNLDETAAKYFDLRKNIIKALKTEAILRECPNYSTIVKDEKINNIPKVNFKDIEYEKLQSEALIIGDEIKEQLKILALSMNK